MTTARFSHKRYSSSLRLPNELKRKRFVLQEYRVRVTESIRYPEALVTVTAVDKDSGKFGQIQYTVSGDGADLFVIEGIDSIQSTIIVINHLYADPSSGVIRVAPNVSLDREKQPSYTFTVIAADQPQGSEEQKRSSALVSSPFLFNTCPVVKRCSIGDRRSQ